LVAALAMLRWRLTSQTSLTREQAIEVLTALKDDLIPCAKIHY
jgi:colicin import membrane protein